VITGMVKRLEVRSRKTGVRRPKSEDRSRESGVGSRKTGVRRLESEDRSPKSEDWSPKSEDRSPKSEDRSPKSEVKPAYIFILLYKLFSNF